MCQNIWGRVWQDKYLNEQTIAEIRNWSRSRFGLQKFAGNYSKDQRFAKTNWLCRCGEKEVEVHLERCQVYSDIASRYNNLREDSQLVAFLGERLERREALERLEAEEAEAPRVAEATDVSRLLDTLEPASLAMSME